MKTVTPCLPAMAAMSGTDSRCRVLIVAGGTGGHIFPALAVAAALRKAGGEVSWLGSGGLENRLIPEHGIPLQTVPFTARRGWLYPLGLLRAVLRACRLMIRRRPNLVLGMGGYASVPGGLAARLLAIPLVIHEQNAIAGKANRLLAFLTRHRLTGFPDALAGGQWLGNPVRPRLSGEQARKNEKFSILILGGSQGARSLNQAVPAALLLLGDRARDFHIIHQCGDSHVPAVRDSYGDCAATVRIEGFIDEIGRALRQADLIICRAGASTLAELAAVGVAALLVPYPHAAADHQTANAQFFVERQAAWMRADSELTPQWLADFLTSLSDKAMEDLRRRMQSLARPDAAAAVADYCLREGIRAA